MTTSNQADESTPECLASEFVPNCVASSSDEQHLNCSFRSGPLTRAQGSSEPHLDNFAQILQMAQVFLGEMHMLGL